MKLRTALLSIIVMASPALAETQDDRDAIAAGMDGLIAAVQAGEFDKTMDTVPPKLLEEMAGQANMSVEDMRAAAADAASSMMGQVTVESFDYDLDAASFSETDEREYATIPTTSVMEAMDQKMKMTGDTLALKDEGNWYLVRIEDPAQLQMLAAAYPDMADVEISAGEIEMVE